MCLSTKCGPDIGLWFHDASKQDEHWSAIVAVLKPVPLVLNVVIGKDGIELKFEDDTLVEVVVVPLHVSHICDLVARDHPDLPPRLFWKRRPSERDFEVYLIHPQYVYPATN